MPWETDGNKETNSLINFLGTKDDQAFAIRVANKQALRIEPAETANLIGGHESNRVSSDVRGVTIGGGGSQDKPHYAAASYSTIGGGQGNKTSGQLAVVVGGEGNHAAGLAATVAGGMGNVAAGDYAFAAGRRAKANHPGSFVWADAQDADLASTADNQLLIRAAGGVKLIGTASDGTTLAVSGTLRASERIMRDDGQTDLVLYRDTNVGDWSLLRSNKGAGIAIIGEPDKIGLAVSRTTTFVGIGTAQPRSTLDVAGTLHVGAWFVGPWPANPDYMAIGVSALPQEEAGNYALLQDARTSTPGNTFLNSPLTLHLRTGNKNRLTFDTLGNATIADSTVLNFGATTRQMLNLYKGAFGIGVQGSTQYFRSYNDFSWFKRGVHSDERDNPGEGGTRLMRLQSNGNLTIAGKVAIKASGTAWSNPSDKRLKEQIAPLEGALDKLLRLRGVTFAWKAPTHHGHSFGRQMGLIADEVEQVFPEWVSRGSDGYKLLSINGFEALVIEALRTLQGENAALRAELEQLSAHAPS